MKHFKFWALLIAPLLILSACKKSDQAPKATNLVTYTYQGTKYTLPLPYLVTVQKTSVQQTPFLSISAAAQGGPGLDITIMNYQQGNSFAVGTQAYVNFNIPGGAVGFYCDGGTVVFNSLTQTHVSGTFSAPSFKAGTSGGTGVPVTGTFDVDIPQQ